MAKKQAEKLVIFPDAASIRVIGFDPGSKKLGAACIQYEPQSQPVYNPRVMLVEARLFKSSKADINDRLAVIAEGVGVFLDDLKPDVVILERPLLGGHFNVRSALALGITHGVIHGLALSRGLPVCKFYPATIKMTAAGHGAASKELLATIMNEVFDLPDSLKAEPDVTDAAAIAFTYAAKHDIRSYQ